MTDILVCTLGASWAVIPEVYGFLAPERLPLYRLHPAASELERQRLAHGLKAPGEIWVCTTQGKKTQEGIAVLGKWIECLEHPPVLRLWQAEGTDQLASADECAHMRELLLRVVLLAHDRAEGGQVVLSLAGGRKTMSADLQWAGDRFGCNGLLHVVGAEPLSEELREATPELLACPLPPEWATQIFPLVVGRGRRSELFDLDTDGQGPIDARRFPVPLAAPHILWPDPDPDSPRLENEIHERERVGSQLFGNFLRALGESEHHENWLSLYRLPPRTIDSLRKTRLDARHRDWLQRLPKADLHRHVGGCLDLAAQRRVGQSLWQTLSARERDEALTRVAPLLHQTEWEWEWPQRLRESPCRAAATVALLVKASNDQLCNNLYACTEPRVALKHRHAQGFAAYERPGELSGSALLGHPAAVAPYAQALVEQARRENLAYVELRGSPKKYAPDFLARFHRALTDALHAVAEERRPVIRFIFIADRRQPERLASVIAEAVRAKQTLPDFIAGIDVAGDESTTRPRELAEAFLPAFEACLPITIHAGEGEAAESIWEAAYHLHADRIGHGLTISEKPELAQRFRDRGICLELCPTSNREVVGYRDAGHPASRDCPTYPLLDLWQAGLPLTLCTDNPGISRTTLADEYLTAARMTGGALTLWDVLALLKQAFNHAFLPAQDKDRLIKRVDARLYEILRDRT
jgi:adenosine deaminase